MCRSGFSSQNLSTNRVATRDVQSGAAAVAYFSLLARRGSGSFFKKKFFLIHEFALNFSVYIRHLVRLNKSDRLAATVLVQTSHRLGNQNIFLNTIAARQRLIISRDGHLWLQLFP
jgi:hypothetical protein